MLPARAPAEQAIDSSESLCEVRFTMVDASSRPKVGLTMGDVAGIGPEVIARGWSDPALLAHCEPFVIGDPAVLGRAIDLVASPASVHVIAQPEEANPGPDLISCLDPLASTGDLDLAGIPSGRLDARAGRAAYEYLVAAIDMALEGRIDAITTLPINKEALRLAGIT